MLTQREERYCADIAKRIYSMQAFLNENSLSEPPEPIVWHHFLSALRKIQGNLSNDCSFIATLLAKQYLQSKFAVTIDAAEKAQGAPGIDIDVKTSTGLRIVAEIKTTVPYHASDFGAQQAASFKKDFAKLSESAADHKFLFVTDSDAFAALKKAKYLRLMPGVLIVHLMTKEVYAA